MHPRYLVVLTHGDLAEHLPEEHRVCVDSIQGPEHPFTSCFLYSIETQHTIG